MFKDTFRKYAFAFAIPALMLASCGSDDPGTDDGSNTEGGNTEPTETVEGVLSSTEAFDYIQSTAKEAVSLFNPEDQKEIMEVCKAFDEAYGDYDFMGGDDYDYSPGEYMKLLRKGMRNPLYLTRASYTVYRIDEFAGVYTPNSYSRTWERTGNSSDIICRCDLNGKTFETKLTWSKNSSWQVPVDDEEVYEIPSTITVTVTYGGKQLAQQTIESNASLEGHRAALKISYNVANIQAVSDFNGTDSQLKETASISVGGKRLIASELTVKGNNLCDISAWAGLQDPTPAQVAQMFRNGEFTINILDRIFFSGSAAGLNKVYDAFDFYEESYDSNYSKSEAKKECEKACNTLNSNLNAEIKFAGSNAVQGELTFVPYVYEEKGYSFWSVYPTAAIRYAADDSVEVLEDVDYDFSQFEAMFNNLLYNYQRFFERLK